MNKIRSILTTVVLASHIISSPLYAQIGATGEETLRFTLQHGFNQENPLPKEIITISLEQLDTDPLLFLDAIRENFSQHLVNQKRPLQINSRLDFILPPDLKKTTGHLPTILINTHVQQDGSGKSVVILPANLLEISEPNGSDKTSLDWKKMTAQFDFTDQFKEITSNVKWLGLDVTSEKEGNISIGESELTGKFDINWIPSQLGLKLPTAEIVDPEEGVFKVSALNFNLDTKVTNTGLELGNLTFEVDKIQYTDEDGLPFLIKNITFNTGSQLEKEVVNYTVKSAMGQITLPKEFAEEKQSVEMSYLANFAVRNLDAEALLALQKTAKELQSQPQDPTMAGMMFFGQLMAVAPKILARSPEIALTQLTVTTPKGNLQGEASVRLDGKKVTSLMQTDALLNALQAKVNLNIGKDLLTKLLMLDKEDAKAVEQEIQLLLKGKLLVQKEEGYEMVADFKEGQLTINGQEVPLSDLLSAGEQLSDDGLLQ